MDARTSFILTGAMGSGKSTVLELLASKGVACIPEPARQILKEQREIMAEGVPERNKDLFTRLMLSRATVHYLEQSSSESVAMFDRGIPDMIGYAEWFGLEAAYYYAAAKRYLYQPFVFWFPVWEAIYMKDEERKMDFREARDFVS